MKKRVCVEVVDANGQVVRSIISTHRLRRIALESIFESAKTSMAIEGEDVEEVTLEDLLLLSNKAPGHP